MHVGQVEVDEALVAGLIAEQFPEWSQLPLVRYPSAGTVNAVYRLGDDLSVRLPLSPEWGHREIRIETEWLPRLAHVVSVQIPEQVAVGEPGLGYPYGWSIHRWLSGINPEPPVGDVALAADVAAFLDELWSASLSDLPETALGRLDAVAAFTARSIEQLDGWPIDEIRRVWDAALNADDWGGEPRLVHGDLMPGNLLIEGRRLTGVIDWGAVGIGDPAGDLMVVWHVFSPESRRLLQTMIDVDAATWIRARGWALAKSAQAIPYYRNSNPGFVANAETTLVAVLEDARAEGFFRAT